MGVGGQCRGTGVGNWVGPFYNSGRVVFMRGRGGGVVVGWGRGGLGN